MKIVAFEVEVGGVSAIIDDMDSLKKAIKDTNTEFGKAKFGTEQFKEQSKQLSILKNLLKDVSKQPVEILPESSVARTKQKIAELKKEFDKLSSTGRESEAGTGLLTQIDKLQTELKRAKDIQDSFGRETPEIIPSGSIAGLKSRIKEINTELEKIGDIQSAEGVSKLLELDGLESELKRLQDIKNDFGKEPLEIIPDNSIQGLKTKISELNKELNKIGDIESTEGTNILVNLDAAEKELKRLEEIKKDFGREPVEIIPEGSLTDLRNKISIIKSELDGLSFDELQSDSGQARLLDLDKVEKELAELQELRRDFGKEPLEVIPEGSIADLKSRISEINGELEKIGDLEGAEGTSRLLELNGLEEELERVQKIKNDFGNDPIEIIPEKSIQGLRSTISEINKELDKIGDLNSSEGQASLLNLDKAKAELKELEDIKRDFGKEPIEVIPDSSIAGIRSKISEINSELNKVADIESPESLAKLLEVNELENELKRLQKVQKDARKEANNQEGSYRALSAELVNLRNQYRDLSETERNSDVGSDILQNIQELDKELKEVDATMGNFGREVGNYGNLLLGANKQQKALVEELNTLRQQWKALPADITSSAKAQEAFTQKVKELEEGIEELGDITGKVAGDYEDNFLDKIASTEGVLGDVGSGVKGLSASFKALLANPVVAFFALLAAGATAIASAFSKTERGAELLSQGSAVLSGIMSELVGVVDGAVDSFVSFTEDPLQGIENLGQSILDNLVNRVKASIDIFGLAGRAINSLVTGDLEGLRNIADEAGTSLVQLGTGLDSDQQTEFAQSVAETTAEVSKNIDAWAKLGEARRAIFLQNIELSKSLESVVTQEELLNQVADDNTKSFAEREEAAEAARVALERRASIEVEIARNSLSLTNQEIALRKANGEQIDDLLQQQLGGIQELAGAERGLTLAIADNEKVRAELKQDRLERDLDILIDGFDNQKTINERLISDDRRTIEERSKLLDETTQLSLDSFNKQIATIQQFTGVAVDANKLLQESDAIRLNEQIRALGLSEIIEGRLLEVIRDRRTAVQDLTEAETDLNDATNEINIAGIEAARDAQITALLLVGEVTEEVTRKRVDAELEAEKEILQAKLKTATQQGESGQADAAAVRLKLVETEIEQNRLAEERKLQDTLSGIEIAKNEKLKALFEEEDLAKITSERIAQIQVDAQIASIQERLDLEKLSVEERSALELELQQARVEAQRNANEQAAANNQLVFDGITMGLEAVQSAITQASALSDVLTQNRISNIERRYEAEIEAAAGNADEIAEIEARRDAEIEEIEREAFERGKKIQIAQALITAAVGAINILSAVSTIPQPFDAIYKGVQIAALATTTALQIAQIASTQFAGGGYTGNGNGKPDNTGEVPVGVVHAHEYVVPKKILKTQRGKQLVEELEGMRTGRVSGNQSSDSYNAFQNAGMSTPQIQPYIGRDTQSINVSAKTELSDEQMQALSNQMANKTSQAVQKGVMDAMEQANKKILRDKRLNQRTS